jgi:hypothetical protein
MCIYPINLQVTCFTVFSSRLLLILSLPDTILHLPIVGRQVKDPITDAAVVSLSDKDAFMFAAGSMVCYIHCPR